MKIFIGISGASGSIYGGRLLKAIDNTAHEVAVCLSDAAVEVILHEEGAADELGKDASRDPVTDYFLQRYNLDRSKLSIAEPLDIGNAFASGSFLADAAIICPCSMSSLACVASGITRNLIHRVADVMMKESRPLVLVPRETPLSEIHISNMLAARRAGALVVPAMPGFYHRPENIDELVDFVVGKILDVLKIEHGLFNRWQGGN